LVNLCILFVYGVTDRMHVLKIFIESEQIKKPAGL